MTAMMGLAERLSAGNVVLIDGGTGTEMEAQGVPMVEGGWCGMGSLTHPEMVQRVHEDYIRAGAELIVANTYASTRNVLEQAGYGDRFEEANRVGIELALAARRACEVDVAVAGSLSTSGMGGSLPAVEEAHRNFVTQLDIQVTAGADLVILEMMRDIELTEAALAATGQFDLPVWVGYSCQPVDGEPWLFEQTDRLVDAMKRIDHGGVDALLVMHTETDFVDRCLDVVEAHWDGPLGVYAQTGKFERPRWNFHDTITPEAYTEACLGWIDRGVRIIGGCCGISPAHIAHLGHALAG